MIKYEESLIVIIDSSSPLKYIAINTIKGLKVLLKFQTKVTLTCIKAIIFAIN